MTGTWPCINGYCADPIHSTCDKSKTYDCPPPACQTIKDCQGLECRNGICVDEYPQRKASGSACDKHSDCLPSNLCKNDKCEQTSRTGTFSICAKDEDCRQGGVNNEVCLKYKTNEQRVGVCLLPTTDPNLIVTAIPSLITTTYTTNATTAVDYDRARNCKIHKDLCGNNKYQRLMKDNCPETCRTSGYNMSCIDNHPNCVYWVTNGYCNSSFYTEQEKQDTCGKSCRLC